SKENKEYQNHQLTFQETYSVKTKYLKLYLDNLDCNSIVKKLKHYSYWSQANLLFFFLWKFFLKILNPVKRLETREFVSFFCAAIYAHLGYEAKARKVCESFLLKNKSELISNFNYDLNIPNKTPMVSVIIPTFNRPQLLNEALSSLTYQTFKDFEVVVINNGNISVKSIISHFEQKISVRLLNSTIKGSVSKAKNQGLKEAKGKYIAYLDDDDWYHPDHLKILLNEIEKGKYLAVYSDAYVELQKLEGEKYISQEKYIEYSRDFNRRYLLIKDYIFTPCVMHHRRCSEIAGLFDENLTTDEDMDMWIRISKLYPFKHIKKVTCSVRRVSRGESLTRDWTVMYKNAKYLFSKHSREYRYNIFVKMGQLYFLNLRKTRAKKYNAFNNYY
ncbi:MAG: glycosyltransferase, partial [Ignavibacteriaceae bacterium]|nr:glycosyltransferase [Ignavibacteriaceae bacterium]